MSKQQLAQEAQEFEEHISRSRSQTSTGWMASAPIGGPSYLSAFHKTPSSDAFNRQFEKSTGLYRQSTGQVQSRNLGPFGSPEKGDAARNIGEKGEAEENLSNASQGDPLPKLDTKELAFKERLYERLSKMVANETVQIQELTRKLLFDTRIQPGSNRPSMKLMCSQVNDMWKKANSMAATIETAGQGHHCVIWLFAALCKSSMDSIFASDDYLSSNESDLSAITIMPLRTLFHQIQHVFTSPNAVPGDFVSEVKSFNRMTHAEIDHMIRNWLTFPSDGIDAATAERVSLENLRHKIGQLFHMQGGLDMAATALTKYESYRFIDSWNPAMNNLNLPLGEWLNEWWTQKRHLLAVAIHREGVDYIHSRHNGMSVSYVRPHVRDMVTAWDTSGLRPLAEFTVEWVKQNERLYAEDRRIIDVLYQQLPNDDPRWQQGQTSAFSSLSTFEVGIQDLSSRHFANIRDIQQHTTLVIQALEPVRMASKLTQLQASLVAQAKNMQVLETEQLKTQLEAARRDNETLRVEAARREDAALRSGQQAKRTMPRVQFNTMDYYGNHSADYGSNGTSMNYDRSHGSSWPPFDSVLLSMEENEEESGGDYHDIPVSVNAYEYGKTVNNAISPVFQTLQLDILSLMHMYPMALQRLLWSKAPPSKQPKPSSVASLVHNIKEATKNNTEEYQKMMQELCGVVQRVTEQLGGDHPVTNHDLAGCTRFPNKSDKIHLCPGSHCMLSCPQALVSNMESHPAFRDVYAMVSHDRLVEQCKLYQNYGHDTTTCGAQSRRYSSCPNCRAYVNHSVYPCMYKIMIQLLRDPLTNDGDKHTYRVQLASGLLTAAWATKDPFP
jgi:hypothetical protein